MLKNKGLNSLLLYVVRTETKCSISDLVSIHVVTAYRGGTQAKNRKSVNPVLRVSVLWSKKIQFPLRDLAD